MGDIQEYFVHHGVKNFLFRVHLRLSHRRSWGQSDFATGVHLANGFTYVEAYLARGMHIDDFAPNLSFSSAMAWTPEYSVMGRVARRIWATASALQIWRK